MRWSAASILLAALSLLSAESTAAQVNDAAARLRANISRERIARFHEMVTRAPHMAGTPGGYAVASEIERALRESGLTTERVEYQAYLSHPKRIVIKQTAPEWRELEVVELGLGFDDPAWAMSKSPGFVAYSASGKVRGPVVYVNYGMPGDYDALKAAGVDVRGAIVLARYGKVHRAVKVHTAETRGAKGILIYSDPADDGFVRGATFPEGPWRNQKMIQRGNAKYSWFWHGDPLTPLRAATPDAQRLKPEDAPTLPRIPAAVLSWGQAAHLLRELREPAAPKGFQGGLGFNYRTGPSRVAVEMNVEMENRLKPIVNVLARIEGAEEPNRWLMVGTHHDAWTFGGVDPGSSCAVLLELARVLGEMKRAGWKPRRTIVLAFWDAEEFGLIGSTEYAEQHAAELREKAVAYINSDLYMAGQLKAGGTASLREAVIGAARGIAHPTQKGSLYDAWRASEWGKLTRAEKKARRDTFEVELESLGSGADFVPFQTFLGIPTLSLEFTSEGAYGSYGAYHSAHDTRLYFEKFGDPGWNFGPALAELLGRVVLRLAGDAVLPLRPSRTALKIEQALRQLEAENADNDGRPLIEDLDLEELRAALARFREAAEQLENALAAGNPAGGMREASERLLRAEKSLLDEEPSGDPARPNWYRHTLYGWDIYALYAGQMLPGLNRALRAGAAVEFARERARLQKAIARATKAVHGGA